MSEEPAQYGAEKRARGRNALEDTIRAELATDEIGKLGAVIAIAMRDGLGVEDIFAALCSVEPRLTDLPREIENRLSAIAPATGKVIAADFGGDKGRDNGPATDL